jgi:hypothetical protein
MIAALKVDEQRSSCDLCGEIIAPGMFINGIGESKGAGIFRSATAARAERVRAVANGCMRTHIRDDAPHTTVDYSFRLQLKKNTCAPMVSQSVSGR